ncbi:MAG: hypothetical protein NC097_08350 [Clostridium sp.]|nr:hypothetical protein [Clostridium sp.]
MKANTSVQNAVENLLANKTFTLGYKFESICSDSGEEQYSYVELSPEDVARLRSLLGKYAKDEVHKHLDEIFDEDTIYDFTCGDEITGIDLDNPKKLYRFGLHSLLKDGTLHRCEYKFSLGDEEYKKLLELMLEDQSLNFNSLEYADNQLYRSIKRHIDGTRGDDACFYENSSPFLVTFDEAQEDVEKILAEHPDWKNSGTCGYIILNA